MVTSTGRHGGSQSEVCEYRDVAGRDSDYLTNAPWMSLFPGLAIFFLTVLGFNLLGDGLRDYFDPTLR